jgi:CubicO group peptidase (beta-lactamase class C family)
LLTHTSGLRDGFTLHELNAARDDVFDNDVMVKILARTRGLNFTPGTEFQYNNSAYAVLASIVSRVSGQSLRAFSEANIFKPLGMAHTHFHDDPSMIVPNRVSGYHRDGSGLHLASENGRIIGNAGLQTTVGNLLLWEQNFAEVRVGDRALITAMQTPAIPTGWSDGSFYGFGLEIAQYRGLRTIGHGGGDRGIAAYVVRYPEQGFAVALLCNLDNIGENLHATPGGYSTHQLRHTNYLIISINYPHLEFECRPFASWRKHKACAMQARAYKNWPNYGPASTSLTTKKRVSEYSLGQRAKGRTKCLFFRIAPSKFFHEVLI